MLSFPKMLRLRLLGAIGIAIVAASCTSDPVTLKNRAIKAGDGYLAKKRFDDAILEYRRAVQIMPTAGDAHYKLAEGYAAMNDIFNAMPEYVRAADRLPEDIPLQLKAGNLLLLAGRFQDAKNRARTALKADPKSVPALVLLGNSLAGLRDLDEALDVAKRAVEADPDRPGLYGNLGTFHLAKGDRELAEQAFRKVIEIAPKSVSGYLALSNFYRSAGKLEEAEKPLRTAYGFAPKDVKLNRAFASLLIESNRAGEAEAYMITSARLDEDFESRLALADYYLRVKRYDDAVRILDSLTSNKKAFGEAKIRTAVVRLAEGKRAEAYKSIEEMLAKNPRDVMALSFKARLLVADHRLDDAAAVVDNAMKINPRSSQVQHMLGVVRMARNDAENARKAFTEALAIDPFSIDTAMELAVLHRKRNEIDTAISYAERSVNTRPDNLAARLTLVRTLLARSEDYPRAENEVKALLVRYPKQASVHSAWGNINILYRKPNDARAAYEKALSFDADNVEAYTGLMALDNGTPRLPLLLKRLDERIAAGATDSGLILIAAKVSILLHQFKHTEDLLKLTLSKDQGQLDAYVLLGELYILQQRVPEAIAQFERYASLDSGSVPAATMLGMLYQRQKNLPAARKWFEAAVQANPRLATAAANNLACIYMDNNLNLDQALQYAQFAVTGKPNQPEFQDTLGWVHYKKQNYESAVKALSAAALQVPNNPIIQYHLGKAYAEMGEDAKARKALEQALKIAPKMEWAADAKQTLGTLVY